MSKGKRTLRPLMHLGGPTNFWEGDLARSLRVAQNVLGKLPGTPGHPRRRQGRWTVCLGAFPGAFRATLRVPARVQEGIGGTVIASLFASAAPVVVAVVAGAVVLEVIHPRLRLRNY